MDVLIQAAILGVVQGMTEFLPISSTAHLIIVPQLLGWDDEFITSAAFDVMLHMGTLAALLIYFWRDLWRLLKAWLASMRDRAIGADPDRRLAWLLFVSVVPGALLGALGEGFFDTFFRQSSSLIYIAVLLVVGGLLLGLAELVGRRNRDMAELHWRDALVIGVAQALALFPGISRSGITIGAGLFVGLRREAAARFSFLMATPIILGAGLWKSRELLGGGLAANDVLPLIVGLVAAAVSGLVAIAFLLSYLRRRSTLIFIVYRFVLAAVIVLYVLTR
jgi:undecaprenyl-diphosphatase